MDINLQSLLEIGEKVDIEIDGESFRSLVQDINSAETVELGRPLRKGAFLPLRVGQKVKLDYYRPDSLYSFDAEVQKIYKNNGVDMVSFLALSEPYKHQRRGWYRLTLSLPVNIKVLSRMFAGDQRFVSRHGEDEFNTECLDISVGGMLFVLPQSLPTGSRIQCSFTLIGDTAPMTLNAMVVRCIWPQEKGYPYRVCIAFLDTSNYIQRKLEKFIIAQQKKMLSKK